MKKKETKNKNLSTKELVEKSLSKKKIKLSKGVLAWTVGISLSGASLISIGYMAPKVPVNVDFIISNTSHISTSMNYIAWPGSVTKFVMPTMESFIGPRHKTDPSGNPTFDEKWNNYVASSSEIDSEIKSDISEMGEILSMKISNDSSKWTYGNNGIDFHPQTTFEDSDYSLRQAKQVVLNDSNQTTSIIMELRDDIYFNNNSDWKSKNPEFLTNVDDSIQDRVKPSDFAFSTELFLDRKNGASNTYMYDKYSNIKNLKECFANQIDNSIEASCGDTSATDSYHKKWGKLFMNVDTHKDTYKMSHQEKLDYINESRNKADSPGILFSDELNVIQYNLSQSTSYFYSIFLNNIFWPTNRDWYNEVIPSYFSFGTSADLFMTNGPYYVEDFDHKYATTYLKNKHYYHDNAILANRWMFRVSDEVSQQALLFKQGYSSYAVLQEEAASFASDPELYKYMKPGIDTPHTRYIFWNMVDENNDIAKVSNNINSKNVNESENRDFTQNINFRKSLYYAYDRTSFLDLSGFKDALPSRSFTTSGMGSIKGSEVQNILSSDYSNIDQMFKDNQGNNSGSYNPSKTNDEFLKESITNDEVMDFVDLVSLYAIDETKAAGKDFYSSTNPWSSNLRSQSFSDIVQDREKFELYRKDPMAQQEVLVAYYWNKFILDMKNIGVNIPSVIELDYLSPNANNDFTYKSYQESIANSSTLSGKVQVVPRTSPGNSFWNDFYSGNWDMAALRWSADFKDPWAFLSLVGNYDATRSTNNNGMWNIFAGTKKNPSSSASGYEEGVASIIEKPTGDLANRMHGKDVFGFGESKWDGSGLTNKTMPEIIASLYLHEKTGDDYLTDGKPLDKAYQYKLNYKKMYELDKGTRYAMMTYIEGIIQDSAVYIVPHAEIITQNASRLFNVYSQSIGYQQYTLAYDARNAPKGFPGINELLEWNGK